MLKHRHALFFKKTKVFGFVPLGGRGEAVLEGANLKVTVPEKLDFVWVKLAL